MALLDAIRRVGRKAGSNLDEYVGGLLGEDAQQLTDEERKQLRRQSLMAIFEAMGSGAASPRAGLERVAERAGGRIAERRQAQQQEIGRQDVQQASANIAARLSGRAGDVGEQTQLQEVRPMSGMSTLGMAATPGGMAAMQASPVLQEAAKQSTKPTEYVYQNVPGVGLVAVNRNNPQDQRIIQREVQRPERVQPTLRQVRLPNGMVQDMWLAPGQAEGTPVGSPYVPGSAAGSGSDGMNDRQRSGLNITREAAYQYAANITGMSLAEIRKKTPAEIEQLVSQRGGRLLQGGTARTLSSLPVVGNFARGIIEANNADLLAPAAQGGSGIAMFQNPTGPITGPDVEIGMRQFPNPMYPAPVQGQMIRSILEQGGVVEEYDEKGNRKR
jgi:hypothetical protein